MENYNAQIERIKSKFGEAKEKDKKFKTFGANFHRYKLGEPAKPSEVERFERAHDITLPDDFKAFLTMFTNGGSSGSQDSAPGPYYGIYSLIGLEPEYAGCLAKPAVVKPKMTDEEWGYIGGRLRSGGDLSDEEYDEILRNMNAGLLSIGTQGCTYYTALVLNGEYRGRLVNMNQEGGKPHFCFENNFLDWYERWLDEIISGQLMTNDLHQFGFTMGGTEQYLLDRYIEAQTDEDRYDSLAGLTEKHQLSEETIQRLLFIYPDLHDLVYKRLVLSLLTKHAYERAKPFLLDFIEEDLLDVYQFVYWYAKPNMGEWFDIVRENMDKIGDNERLYHFSCFLLQGSGRDYASVILPFTKHKEASIRKITYYQLGELSNKRDYLDYLIQGLYDEENAVIHTCIQAMHNIKDKRLLLEYKRLIDKFPVDQNSILINISHWLKDINLTEQQIREMNPEEVRQYEPKWVAR